MAFFMAIETYTDQEILNALRRALFEIASNGANSWSVNGRVFTALDMDKLQSAIELYESRTTTRKRSAVIKFTPIR